MSVLLHWRVSPRLFFILALSVLLALALALPASGTDYRRSCLISITVNPFTTGRSTENYNFRVFNTVTQWADVNDARRAIRGHVENCVLTHWANRDGSSRPAACHDSGRIDMGHYPFDAMLAQIRDDICARNPDALRLSVDIELFIRGKRGCLEYSEERARVDPAAHTMVAPDFRLNCPIREGGGWEMGGVPSAPPLPNIRLPGNDIGRPRDVSGGWQDCWRLCELHDPCNAWTWRAPGTWQGTSSAVCLLKHSAGPHIADGCCVSGIKEQ